MKLLISLFSVVCIFMNSAESLAGAEGHGGNYTVLEFVKIGQAIKGLLSLHPEWNLSQKVTARRLSWAINNTFVSAGTSSAFSMPEGAHVPRKVTFTETQLDTLDDDGNIYIHLPQWNKLSCDKKIREVFHLYISEIGYGALFGKKIDDSDYEFSSQLMEKLGADRCFEFLQNKNSPGYFSSLPLEEQVRILRRDIFEAIDNHPDHLFAQVVRSLIESHFFKSALNNRPHTNVLTSGDPQLQWKSGRALPPWLNDKDIVTIADRSYHELERYQEFPLLLPDEDLSTRNREIQLATEYLSNDWHPLEIYMWINEKRWATFSYRQKFELIFHEYLSLFTTVDQYYRVSSLVIP